jgi:hypothetical protein
VAVDALIGMTSHAQDVFDPSAYPRTYALSVPGKWLVSVLGLVMVSLSLAGAIFLSFGDQGRNPAGSAILLMVCAVFALMGIYLLAVALFYRVILQADSIQVFEIYRRSSVSRLQIEGRSHFAYGQGMTAWVLVPKPGSGGKIKLSNFLKTDKDFRAWIQSLPDLDLDKKRAADRERREAVASLEQHGIAELTLRRIAGGLSIAAYGLGFASFFVRDVNHLLTWALMVLPWVAILLVAKFAPFYRFGGPRNSPLPDLSLALIGPGFFLTLGVLQSVVPVGWEGPLWLSVLGSVMLVGVAFWRDPWLKQHRGTTVLLLLLCCSYGYGAGMQVNALLDGSTPQTYRVVVTAKHVSHGKSTSYHLSLAPWGPKANGQDLMVPYSQYAVVRPGDTVCMLLRSGALGVAWSELGGCGGSLQ